MNDDTAYSLIAADLAGQLGEEDKAKLDAWRKATPENEACFRECAEAWRQMDPGPVPDEPFREQEWRGLAKRLGLPIDDPDQATLHRHPRFRASSRPPRRRIMAGLAAAAVLLSLLGIFRYRWHHVAGPTVESVTLAGEQRRLSLPDGTAVLLNAGSRLRWGDGLKGKRRTVMLEGQAYFEVSEDGRPFSVRTPTAEVRVLGTSFEVWARNAKTRVIVREGRVSLDSLDGKGSLLLLANQKATLESGEPGPPKSVNAARLLVWMHGNLVFHSQMLLDVVTDLEQAFGKTIELDEDIGPELTVTASFRDTDLPTVLSELCLALDLTYAQTGNNYRISR